MVIKEGQNENKGNGKIKEQQGSQETDRTRARARYIYSYGYLSSLANVSEQANSIFIYLPWSKQMSSECLNRLAASPTE